MSLYDRPYFGVGHFAYYMNIVHIPVVNPKEMWYYIKLLNSGAVS